MSKHSWHGIKHKHTRESAGTPRGGGLIADDAGGRTRQRVGNLGTRSTRAEPRRGENHTVASHRHSRSHGRRRRFVSHAPRRYSFCCTDRSSCRRFVCSIRARWSGLERACVGIDASCVCGTTFASSSQSKVSIGRSEAFGRTGIRPASSCAGHPSASTLLVDVVDRRETPLHVEPDNRITVSGRTNRISHGWIIMGFDRR